MSSQSFYPQTVLDSFPSFISAGNGTSPSVIFGSFPNTDGAKLQDIMIVNTDTSDHVVQFYLTTVLYLFATVTIPASAGNISSVPPVSLFKSTSLASDLNKDVNGQPYLYLPHQSQALMYASTTVAMPGSTRLRFLPIIGSF
jgi:hypothetical protein